MKKELLNLLEEKLMSIDKYTNGNVILKNKVIEDILKLEKEVLDVILGTPELREVFTVEINGITVFDKVRLQSVLSSEDFLPNSYTKYKNKIGLFAGINSINNSDNVVLNWAYKDCVLQGGQTKDSESNTELFFNEIIGADDIDTMLSPKVLTNFKKYTTEGVFGFNGDVNPVNDNLIIKGNNLLALHSIKEKYKNKIKLIYIDVPYNTQNDSFRYNDSFTHSTWLTFMKNRLEIAMELLTTDGAICLQCDDNEQAYLSVLCDEILGRENRINTICVNMSNVSGKKIVHAKNGIRFPKTKEYILMYAKNKPFCKLKIPKNQKKKWDSEYNKIIPEWTESMYEFFDNNDLETINKTISKFKLISVSEYCKDNNIVPTDDWKKENSYRIFATKPNESLLKNNKNKEWDSEIVFVKNSSLENKLITTTFNKNTNTARIELVSSLTCNSVYLSDNWTDISTTGGVSMEGGVKLSNGKKPEKLLKRIIDTFTQENDIIMDFFMGSGTTCAVAHKMGRKYVGIEQMDYIEELAITRFKNVINGEQSGISKDVNWRGGGEFIYCELKQLNQKYIDLILKCEDASMLNSIYDMIISNAFVHYTVEIKEINVNRELFNELTLNEKRNMLIQILDKNMLYVNYSDIQDITFDIDESDKIANKLFYQKKK